MTCSTEAMIIVFLMKTLLVSQTALTSNYTMTNLPASQKTTPFSQCVTEIFILCEEQRVRVGLCFTCLNGDSEIPVFGFCPYFTASKINED